MVYHRETVDHYGPLQVVLDTLNEVGFRTMRRTVQFGAFNE
jgi:hypothetical protein